MLAVVGALGLAIALAPWSQRAASEVPELRHPRSTSPTPTPPTPPGTSPGPNVHVHDGRVVRFVAINVAVPPFNDVHVRRALAFLADRAGFAAEFGRDGHPVETAGHLFPDGLEGDQLDGWDPYATATAEERLVAARYEMSRSRFDRDHDGRCDAAVCSGNAAPSVLVAEAGPSLAIARELVSELEPVGIEMRLVNRIGEHCTTSCDTPFEHAALRVDGVWAADFPDPAYMARRLLTSDGIWPGCCNPSLLGATPEQLDRFGYGVRRVPNVEDWIEVCEAIPIGAERTECWVRLDRRVMTAVVPVIPYAFEVAVDTTSARVAGFAWDAFTGVPAFDRLALERRS